MRPRTILVVERSLFLELHLLQHPVVSEQPAKNSCDVTTLEESFHKVKFCKYLRTPSLPDEEEKLPDELIPKSLIVGHTQWLPGDSRATHRN